MQGQRIVNLGMIGLGPRGETLLATYFCLLETGEALRFKAICDVRQDRVDKILRIFKAHGHEAPKVYHDYHEMLKDPEIEALFVPTSWNSHLRIACDAMRAGKNVGIEVGGAASLEELWNLVHAAEETGVGCMMLENCCYGRNEMMVMNMVRQGVFGELVYCECGYEHCLAEDIPGYCLDKAERFYHNRKRNGELYPTHGLGPVAKMLDINRGNRFLTISSHATKQRGFTRAMEKFGNLPGVEFNEGDVVTSIIKCANGQNITMTHAISLPRPYSRDMRIQGTEGIWLENANGIYIDGISDSHTEIDAAGNPYWVHKWDPVESFYEKYDHPVWQAAGGMEIGGHGGLDALTIRAFTNSVRTGHRMPIDVYDCAAWMSVSCLSEQSIAMGGMPVPFPDFTNGNWIYERANSDFIWDL